MIYAAVSDAEGAARPRSDRRFSFTAMQWFIDYDVQPSWPWGTAIYQSPPLSSVSANPAAAASSNCRPFSASALAGAPM